MAITIGSEPLVFYFNYNGLTEWDCQHNRNTLSPAVQVFVYVDGVGTVEVFPKEVRIIDANNIRVYWNDVGHTGYVIVA